MTRFQINVGDEFPVEPEAGPQGVRRMGRFRHPPFGAVGVLVRGLFVLSLAVLAVTHPLPAAVGLGGVLLLGRFKGQCGGAGRWHRGDHGRHRWHGGFRRDDGFERGAFV